MDLGSVMKNGKKLRRGYTTGSCAAAAAKAATQMLYTGENLNRININTPSGIVLNLPVVNIEIINENTVKCSIQKDSGDDPDITNGIEIFATARMIEDGITLKGGVGVGVVTLAGLSVTVGQPAINPVPRKMIIESVKEALPEGKGVEITISTPKGEEIARKTFNPKLGIKGGISILGTTGIVEPMSEEALKESLKIELKILKEKGHNKIIFTPGNYGKKFVKDTLDCKEVPLIKISNFVGFMLNEAVNLKFEKILLVGDIGKFIKIAAGIFHTHSKVADARTEIMAAYAAMFGANQSLVKQIVDMNTTAAVIDVLTQNNINVNDMYVFIANRITKKASEHIHGEVEIETMLFSNEIGLLAQSENAEEMLAELKEFKYE